MYVNVKSWFLSFLDLYICIRIEHGDDLVWVTSSEWTMEWRKLIGTLSISSAPNVKNVTWKLFLVQRWSPTVFCTKPPRLTNIQWGVCILFLHQWRFRINYQEYWRHSFTHPRISDWNTHESLINMERAAIIRVKLTIICFKFINI